MEEFIRKQNPPFKWLNKDSKPVKQTAFQQWLSNYGTWNSSGTQALVLLMVWCITWMLNKAVIYSCLLWVWLIF